LYTFWIVKNIIINNIMDNIITTLSDNIDNIYINNNESNILYTINNNITLKSSYDNQSNIINKIENLIVHDFIDDPNRHSSYKNNSSIISSNINENIKLDKTSSLPKSNENLKISVPTNFFECFDENLSINNAIVCDKFDPNTSYVFESEDMRKNDIYPFEDGIYNIHTKKSTKSRINIIALSAVKLLGGSWLESLL
jgi:hypothetical protein